jgi:hypothetical protein
MDTGLDGPCDLGKRTSFILGDMDRVPNETERFTQQRKSKLSQILFSPATLVAGCIALAGIGLYFGNAPGRNITAVEDGMTILPATVPYANTNTLYTNSTNYTPIKTGETQ